MDPPVWHLSRAGHVEAGLNLRGPSRKAKYSLATDSEPSSASERWEEPLQGEDSEPETTCLQAVGGRLVSLPPWESWEEMGRISLISPIEAHVFLWRRADEA